MSDREGGEVLFDGKLNLGLDIPALWKAGRTQHEHFPKKDMRRSGNLLLKEHLSWAYEREDIGSAESLQAKIDTTTRHFRQLRRLGMSIVSHETVVNPGAEWPVNPHANNGETVVAYSASAYVPNLQPLYLPSTREAVPAEKIERVVLLPLRRYVDWGKSTGESELLFDLFTSDQYGWQASMGVVFLHDIDPHLAPIADVAGAIEDELEGFLEDVNTK